MFMNRAQTWSINVLRKIKTRLENLRLTLQRKEQKWLIEIVILLKEMLCFHPTQEIHSMNSHQAKVTHLWENLHHSLPFVATDRNMN